MNNQSSAMHKRTQHSTTLNRKYVQRPTAQAATTQKSEAIQSTAKRQAEDLKRRQAIAEKINRERLAAMKTVKTKVQPAAKQQQEAKDMPATAHPLQQKASARMAKTMQQTTAEPTAKELKDEAIEKALRSVATMETKQKKTKTKGIKAHRMFTFKKVAIASLCAAVAVGAIAYFVQLNMPDISVRVTAMQSGIDDPYPSYVPHGYSFSSSVSEGDKIMIEFVNSDGEGFTITEEKSSWDSKALLNNVVEEKWSDYQPIREQGLTIYVSGSDAMWVNGGIKYEIDATGNNLTKKQIKAIVMSL